MFIKCSENKLTFTACVDLLAIVLEQLIHTCTHVLYTGRFEVESFSPRPKALEFLIVVRMINHDVDNNNSTRQQRNGIIIVTGQVGVYGTCADAYTVLTAVERWMLFHAATSQKTISQ